ncbi:hypothetical protein C3747_112g85 [Trypanosoma cruzi]|uniref:Uncharacterized protein n=2 Tax=Trypanosoma cruzi TaxID=5693 RepID=A0A2V2WFQ4_TRYCR|nr:hypothetical protein C3747_112g85 [Trypanosoma cruzi]RNC59008.1 hypothetical protein TcCL_ESM03390 [Trypanosoma cruzi]
MALLYHRCYDTDLTAVTEGSSSLRETRMSWSYTDPRVDETIVVLLLAAPATFKEPADGDAMHYALKVILFTATAAENQTERVVYMESARREVHSAIFEFHAPLDVSVVKGTSGLVFASTRQFFFHAVAGGKSLDRFVFLPVERTWERQCHALRPLDEVEPISRLLAEVNGDSQPQLLLMAKTGFSPASESLAEEDSFDLLLVASREEGTRGSLQKRQRMARLIKRNTTTSHLQTEGLYTFVLAVVRCTIPTERVATAKWELLHLCVDRGVPFQKQENTGSMDGWNTEDPRSSDSVIHPGQCTWCYIQCSNVETEGMRQGAEKKSIQESRARGIVVAIVPQPSHVVTVVCGGFDAESHSYLLGFVANQATGSSNVLHHPVEEMENPEETLWSLSEDTHTVQMMVLGTPTVSLHGPSEADAGRVSPRVYQTQHALRPHSPYKYCDKSTGGWMRQVGLSMVLRFVVDFLDDGIGHVRTELDVIKSGRQGLYLVAGVPWAKSRHGRFPIPRTVCWIGTAPLPIGKALSSMVLYPDNTAENGYANITVMNATMSDEDATSWYHTLPTSIASSPPAASKNGALRCFVSVNTLLKKTRLTYVLEITSEKQNSDNGKKIQASEWLYTRPQGGKTALHDDLGTNEILAACLARSVVMRNKSLSKADGLSKGMLHESLLDGTVPEAVMYEAWRSVALGRSAVVTMSILEKLSQSMEVNVTQEVRELANALRHFLLTFLVELDWIAHADNSILRDITFLVLGAVNTQKLLPGRRDSAVRDEDSFVSLLAPNERRSMYWLLRQSDMWLPLVAALFAWVNHIPLSSEDEGEGEILLEDVVQKWEKMAACESGGGRAFDDLLRHLRRSQNTSKYQHALVVLMRGNLSLREIASFAVWKDDDVRNPFIVFLQLLLEVAVACEDAAEASSAPNVDISQIVFFAVQERLQSDGTLGALLEFLHEWNFSFLEDWPLTAMSGGLPVVYLILHLATADRSGKTQESHRFVSRAAQVLRWLCGDRVERAAEVLNALCAAKVPLLALCFTERQRRNYFRSPEAPPSGDIYAGGGGSNISRAMHHILGSSTASLLRGALTDLGVCSPTDDTNSEKFILFLWTLVLENDESAAFNPNLLQLLYEALFASSGATLQKSVPRAVLLLEFLRPVFLSTFPRVFAAVGDQQGTVGCALAATAVSPTLPSAAVLGPPLDETESVERVWIKTLHEIRRLINLHVADCLEVQCLSLLFNAFEASCTTLSEGPRSGSEAATEDIPFTFSPAEMYFLALQVISNEPPRFVVAVEVMRRRIRSYVLHKMRLAIQRADEGLLSSRTSEVDDAKPLLGKLKRDTLWWDSKVYLNDVAENLALVISAFEKAAPLYSHAVLFLFLDESLALMEDSELGRGEKEERPVSEDVRGEMLQCVRQAAHSRWAKLHRQEKKFLFRLLSHRLSLPDQEKAEGDVYHRNEVHQQVVRDMARMKEALQQRNVSAALLRAVRKDACHSSSRGGSTVHMDSNDDMGSGISMFSTELELLFKEEAYVRQSLQRHLRQEYDNLIGSSAFCAALGTLYLALREEQRRRVFVVFVIEQEDILLTFGFNFFSLMKEAFRRGVRVLWKNAMECFQRQLRYLLLQERESRSAVEAVCFVEHKILVDLSNQQCAVFDAENSLRLSLVEEEEAHRDTFYELFAREEMMAQRRYEARLEEEAWREEEAQWEMELQRRQEEAGDEKGADTMRRSSRQHTCLEWQQRQLAATEEKGSVFLRQPSPRKEIQAPSPLPTSSSSLAPPPAATRAAVKATATPPVEALPPANALAPLIQMDSTTATSVEAGGFNALLDASESLFGAFSRLQRQIITTVAPPPTASAKNDTSNVFTAIAPLKQEREEDKGENEGERMEHFPRTSPPVITSALKTSPSITEKKEGWDDVLEDMSPPSTQTGRDDDLAKKEQGALEKTPTSHEDSSKRLRLRASTKTSKIRAPRQRRLGDVLCLEKAPEEKKETDITHHEEKPHENEPQTRSEVTVSKGDVALCALEEKEVSPSVDDDKKKVATIGSHDADQTWTKQACSGSAEGDQFPTMELKADVPQVLMDEAKKKEEEGEKEEEVPALRSETSMPLKRDEETARFALFREERLARALLFRCFILVA